MENKVKRSINSILLFIVAIICLALGSHWTDAGFNAAQLEYLSKNSGKHIFRGVSSYVAFNSNYYVVVLYTADNPEYDGVKYLAIARTASSTKITLISGPGQENSRIISGLEAESYLAEKKFDLAAFDKIWKEYHQR